MDIDLEVHPGIDAIACDTDGIDGSEDNAGCLCGPGTLAKGRSLARNARERLEDNDGYGFFAALNNLVISGPTLTHVNDFRAIMILPPPSA